MTKQAFAYIRVSTTKQGEGVSLEVQQNVISASAKQRGYIIVEWFTEKKTAAKAGRPAFTDMLHRLKKKEAQAVFIHKIDRSARNWHDWACLGDLVDAGIEVFFANESIDLKTRGGRLAADMQAAVATDYIRNLKEETKKGQDGRLKQGLFPWRAPLGYRDHGKGEPKTIDPIVGALVRRAFELYAQGGYTLNTLAKDLNRKGLRSLKGTPINENTLTKIFRNPFYTGLIHIRKWGESFQGVHEPLISRSVFDRVQNLLSGKVKSRGWRHCYLYRGTFRCATCRRSITCERQKGRVYIRCHTKACHGITLREDSVTVELQKKLSAIHLHPDEWEDLRTHVAHRLLTADIEQVKQLDGVKLQIAQLDERKTNLTDALIDGLITKEIFTARHTQLLSDRQRLEERRRVLEEKKGAIAEKLTKKFELVKTVSLSDEKKKPEEIADLVKRASSNLMIDRKNVVVDWVSWIQVLEKRAETSCCALERDSSRNNTTPKWCEAVVDAMLCDDS